MSRIGNSPIKVPEGVTIDIQPSHIKVKGKLGELSQNYSDVEIKFKDNVISVLRSSESKNVKSKHGLYRSLIYNMVQGVSVGFTKELELVGVGYRASNQGQKLDLALGFSHNILFEIAPEVKIETISEKGKNPIVKLTSHDKQLVGYVASKIRSFQKARTIQRKGNQICWRTDKKKSWKVSIIYFIMGLTKIERRNRIRKRIRKIINGTASVPRLSVYRSNKEIYAQLIDDNLGKTIVSASSRDKEISKEKLSNKTETASIVGKQLAVLAQKNGISKVRFDRNGYLYHGRVKALADGVREGGIKF